MAFCSVEYNVSYVYHALFSYFDRDNVGLPGFAKWAITDLLLDICFLSNIHGNFSGTVKILLIKFFVVNLFRFFKDSSDEEREHAEKLMKYQVPK